MFNSLTSKIWTCHYSQKKHKFRIKGSLTKKRQLLNFQLHYINIWRRLLAKALQNISSMITFLPVSHNKKAQSQLFSAIAKFLMVKFEESKKRQNSWDHHQFIDFLFLSCSASRICYQLCTIFSPPNRVPFIYKNNNNKKPRFFQGSNTDNWDANIFSLVDKIKIKDFLQSEDPIILSKVFLKLDHLPDSNWQSLGLNLGMEHEDLQQIKIDCANQNENPAHELIEYIYRRDPTMTISIFKKHLTNIQRNDVEYELDSMKGVMSSNNCDIIQPFWILLNHSSHASSQT